MPSPEFDFSQIDDSAIHGTLPIDQPFYTGTTLVSDNNISVTTATLLAINGWPEAKTVMEEQCIKIFGKRICTKIPVAYVRTSKLEVIATVSFPSAQSIEQQVKDCVAAAIAASVVTVIYSEQYEAAAGIILGYLKTCLLAKGVKDVSEVQVGVASLTTPGPWQRKS